MKPIANYNDVQPMTDRPVLPAGAYPVIIKAAEEITRSGQNGEFSYLEISFDISEGEYKGFFAEDYRSQTYDIEDRKWKGILRLYTPKEDGSEKDETTKRVHRTATVAIEESNSGYQWDWDETKLKGKKVVCLFQNKEWEYKGRTGWKAQPYKFISTEQYEKGKYKLPKDKPLANRPASVSTEDFAKILDDDDLPF